MTKTNSSLKDMDDTPVAWGAVWSLAVGVAALVTAEFMPVSLLTPMARGIGITEGLAGQTVSATAFVAIITSIFLLSLIRDINRKTVMLSFSSLLVLSSLVVSFASNFWMLIIGRVLLGIALGGFWSMATSVAIRLVPAKHVAKAFAIIFGGVSASTVISGPLGSFLEGIVGWRIVFVLCSILGGIAFFLQAIYLPSLKSQGRVSVSSLFEVLKRHEVYIGMGCVALTFCGHIAFYTYMRPYLEAVTHLDATIFASLLFAFGIANFTGNSIAGSIVSGNLRRTMGIVSLSMFVIVLVLLAFGDHFWIMACCVTLWGFAFGFIPVGWSTWLMRAVPDQTEAGGSLYVACIQVGLLVGAGLGGLILDFAGVRVAVAFAGIVMLASAMMIFVHLQSGSSTLVRNI